MSRRVATDNLAGVAEQLASRRRTAWRTAVHLLLVVIAVVSLILEPVLGVHIALGLFFVWLVVMHLAQRRRTAAALLRQSRRMSWSRSQRMAFADLLLALLTLGVLVSGIVDWALGQPTPIRWHAITGVLLAIALCIHTVRRRRRLRGSEVR
jgi:hypothetical protein